MAYVRAKNVKGNTYYYLVKSVREGGKVRQVFLDYLGTEKPAPRKKDKVKKEE